MDFVLRGGEGLRGVFFVGRGDIDGVEFVLEKLWQGCCEVGNFVFLRVLLCVSGRGGQECCDVVFLGSDSGDHVFLSDGACAEQSPNEGTFLRGR